MAVLYRGGSFFDGTQFFDQNHAMLVDGKVIKQFGKASEFQGFAGEIIDTTGMTVMPGLIDCHVHLVFSGENDSVESIKRIQMNDHVLIALENAQKNLQGGVTSVRDCGGRDYIERAVRDAINKGKFDGPTIHIAGKFICMTGGHVNALAREADGVDEIIKAVREQVKEGVDHIKIMATGGVVTEGVDPEDSHYHAQEIAAGITEAKRFHKPTASHAQGADGIMNAVTAGVTSIEHGIFLDAKGQEEMLKRGTYLVPTLCAIDGILAADTPDYMKEKCHRIGEVHKKAIKTFYKAGGKIVLGTDAGTPGNMHGDNAQEIRCMVNAGMDIKDVLVAATKNGADLMRLKNRGTLTAGSFADMLIVNGDPLKNVEVVADPKNHVQVIKEGKVVMNRYTAPGVQKLSLAS